MRTSLVTLCALLLPGCVWTGNGVAKQEERTLAAFDTIEATDIVDVVVEDVFSCLGTRISYRRATDYTVRPLLLGLLLGLLL